MFTSYGTALQRNEQITRFGKCSVVGFYDHAGLPDRLVVHFARIGLKGPHQVQVRPWSDQKVEVFPSIA